MYVCYGGFFSVHLRIRLVDQLIPKTLYPSTSGNTYWQIEAESSILSGTVDKQTGQYLHFATFRDFVRPDRDVK